MATKHIRKCSTSLAIREIQIKTTMRSHLTPVRMENINKAGNNNFLSAFYFKNDHDSLGGDTRLLSSQIIISTISVITINLKVSHSPTPIHFWHLCVKCHFQKKGENMLNTGFSSHSTPFVRKNVLVAKLRILIQECLTISHQ